MLPSDSTPDAFPPRQAGGDSATGEGHAPHRSPEDPRRAVTRIAEAQPSLPDSEPADPDDPVAQWPPGAVRYRAFQHIGRGGMGWVYKAWDPKLRRTVAIKVLQGEASAQVRRFRQEAQAQARVQHEHVCPIYEVGEVDGRPFIAMQFIDGPTLRELAPSLPLADKLRVMMQAAEGVHAAHRKGMVHRDLKPGNMLVERRGPGELHAYVVDFGLARDTAAPGVTQAGLVVGTPAYMAPEQIRGDAVLDPRTDVYGLGATLYEVLSGRQPFSGEHGTEVLLRALAEDAAPLHRREVPRDLETIVHCCMEKEPARRYASARELAEDLGRFLEGRPILARRPRFSYRLGKWIRRNRALVATGAVAAVALLFAAGWGLRGALFARAQARAAERFAALTQQAEGRLRMAYLEPPHPLGPDLERLGRTMTAIGQAMGAGGASVQGPGHLALGRGHLLLDDLDRAREHFEAAWNRGYRTPDLSAAYGTSLARLFLEELEHLGSLSLQARRATLEPTLGMPARSRLQEVARSGHEDRAYLEGLLALVEGDLVRGRACAIESRRGRPWHVESWALESLTWTLAAAAAGEGGRSGEANAALAEADARLREGLAVNRSALPLLRAEVHRAFLAYRLTPEDPPARNEGYVRALAAVDAVFAVLPGDLDTAATAAAIQVQRAVFELNRAGDLLPWLEDAIRRAEAVLRRRPSHVAARMHLGKAHAVWGAWQAGRGDDPRTHLRSAIEALGGVPEERATHHLLGDIGNTYHFLGVAEFTFGADPRASLAKARDHHTRAAALYPLDAHFGNLAADWLQEAEYLLAQDLPLEKALQPALEAVQRSLQLNPANEQAYTNLANHWILRADLDLQSGKDAGPALEEALRAARRVPELGPGDWNSWINLGFAAARQARNEGRAGRSPEPALAEGWLAVQRGLAIDANAPPLHLAAAQLQVERLRHAPAAERRRAGRLDRLRWHLAEAARLAPREAGGWILLAEALSFEGAASRAEAQAALRRAVEVNPSFGPRVSRLSRDYNLR